MFSSSIPPMAFAAETDYGFADAEPSPYVTVVAEGSRKALVGEYVIEINSPAIVVGDIVFIPVEDVSALLLAEVVFDEEIFTVELNDRIVMLEASSWNMMSWIDGEEQPTICLESILIEPSLYTMDDVVYVPLEILATTLGLYVSQDSFAGHSFVVVSTEELYVWELQELIMDAHSKLENLGALPEENVEAEINVDADVSADVEAEFNTDVGEEIFSEIEAGYILPTPHISVTSLVVQDGNTRALVDEVNIVLTDPAIVQGGVMLVPVGSLSGLMGATVNFNNPILSVESSNQRVELEVGSTIMRRWVNGVRQPDINLQDILGDTHIAQPVQLINGIVYAPLRVLAYALGGYVEWIPEGRFVVVTMLPISSLEARRLADLADTRLVPGYSPSVANSPASVQLVIDNGEITGDRQLSATVLPTNAPNRSVTWSSQNAAVATVSASGFVTAHSSGTTTIRANSVYPNVFGTTTVSVVERASSVTLNRTNLTLSVQGDVGEEFTLTGTVAPASATNRTIRWETNDPNIAFVYPNGRVRAVNPGTATITAYVDGSRIPVLASCTVVVQRLATDIILDRETLALHMTGSLSETETVNATVFPTDAVNVNNVLWTSSNTNVAVVDQNGNVTSTGAGTATIRATVQGSTNVWAEAVVTVHNMATNIVLDQSAITLIIEGDQFGMRQLVETVLPIDAINRSVTWISSDPNVATVDQNGNVTAANAGVTTISVTVNGTTLTASCDVYVVVIPTGITLNYTARTLVVNNPARNSVQLQAELDAASGLAGTIEWTSDDHDIATVDQNGEVTAVGPGVTYIRATVLGSGIVAVCRITVVNEVQSISIPDAITLEINGANFGQRQLPVTINPNYACDQRIIWTTSNPAVATVDEHGTVTARGPGRVLIVATSVDGGLQSSCVVTVISRVTHVLVDQSEMFLVIDGNQFGRGRLNVTVLPLNATNRSVQFVGYDPRIVEVSSDGWVIARDSGTTEITIRAVDNNGIYSETRVTVIVRAVGIKVYPEEVAMTVSNTLLTDSKQLTATIYPANATSQAVTWVSSNENVVRVDRNGNLQAIRPGTANVTAWIGGISASSAITVEPEIVLKMDWGGVFVNGEVMYHSFPGAVRVSGHAMAPVRVLADATNGASSWTSATQTAQVYIDGRIVDFQLGSRTMRWRHSGSSQTHTVSLPIAPMMLENYPGRVYVPVRAVFEAIGWNVHWQREGTGEEYILLTKIDMGTNANRHLANARQKINHAMSPDNWNIQAPTGIMMQSTTQIAIGQPQQLRAVMLPAIESLSSWQINWRSSNSAIVRVDASGTAIGVAPGRATITATNAYGHQVETQVQVFAGLPFTDVPSNWAWPYIWRMNQAGVMQGTCPSGTRFSPNSNFTNAQLAATLFRMRHGRFSNTSDRTDSGFSDVASDTWYAPYARWARVNNVMLGNGGRFSPSAHVSRADIALAMHQYVIAFRPTRESTSVSNNRWNAFPDRYRIPAGVEYYNALRWANNHEIIRGTVQGRLNPDGTATRAEVATMLVRLMVHLPCMQTPPPAPPPPAPPQTAFPRYGIVTGNGVRVRPSPASLCNRTNESFRSVNSGDMVWILAQVEGAYSLGNNQWYRIRIGNRNGYVHRNHVDSNIPQPPQQETQPPGRVVWPMPTRQGLGRTNITSPFGRRNIQNSVYHWGIDIDANTNERVYAMMAGSATRGYNQFNGNYVRIVHANGYISLYLHLNSVAIPRGVVTEVAAGTHIGGAGTTGHSTGVHLHFEVRTGSGSRETTAINPIEIFHWNDPRSNNNGRNPNPLFVFVNGRFEFNEYFVW